MAKNRTVWCILKGGRWRVKREGANSAISIHLTRAEACRAASRIAAEDSVELVLQNGDGEVTRFPIGSQTQHVFG